MEAEKGGVAKAGRRSGLVGARAGIGFVLELVDSDDLTRCSPAWDSSARVFSSSTIRSPEIAESQTK